MGGQLDVGLRIKIISTKKLEVEALHTFAEDNVEELDETHVAAAQFAHHLNGHGNN